MSEHPNIPRTPAEQSGNSGSLGGAETAVDGRDCRGAAERVRWYRGHRTGARVSVTLAGTEHVLDVESARDLHRSLGLALDEIDTDWWE